MENNKFLNLLEQILESIQLNTPTKEIMNVDELSRYIGFSKSYIYKLSSQRIIPHYKPAGKTVFFKKSEIDDFILSTPMPSIPIMTERYFNSRQIKNK